jgi:hypothetical protein
MNIIDKAIAALPSEQQSEWAEIQRGARDPIETLSAWTPEHRNIVSVAWAEWAYSREDARIVLKAINAWSRKLGVFIACRVAREALRYVPAGEDRPLRAIETAERWCRREATAEECDRAANAAYSAASAACYAAAAAHSAAKASSCAARATTNQRSAFDVASAADAAAAAAAYASYAIWGLAYNVELSRMCVVIADDMLKGRTADWLL